jgi:hypothetical protein
MITLLSDRQKFVLRKTSLKFVDRFFGDTPATLSAFYVRELEHAGL